MSLRGPALAALCLTLAACGGVRADLAARPAPAPGVFDARELVDVLEPDAIPAIDRPSFEAPEAAAAWLAPDAPVVVVEVAGDARAYPLAILVWHEIVNDTVGGRPVAVTYCPLCDAAVAFDRTVGGRAERFGSSGKLYRSDLVLYDRTTRSLWPQLGGRAALGSRAGSALERIPAAVGSLGEFRAAHPTGKVLSRETGAVRGYGANPYEGYDSRAAPHADFIALAADRRLPAMERVLGVAAGGEARAYPFRTLRERRVVADRVGGEEVVVLWRPGVRSALDALEIARGREVGAAAAFSPFLDGRRLSLEASGEAFRDRETGSTWSGLGVALAGPLAGRRLAPAGGVSAFWFAWAAFSASTSVG